MKQANPLYELESAYLQGDISKARYIKQMYKYHDMLFAYAEFLMTRDVAEIVIGANNVRLITKGASASFLPKPNLQESYTRSDMALNSAVNIGDLHINNLARQATNINEAKNINNVARDIGGIDNIKRINDAAHMHGAVPPPPPRI